MKTLAASDFCARLADVALKESLPIFRVHLDPQQAFGVNASADVDETVLIQPAFDGLDALQLTKGDNLSVRYTAGQAGAGGFIGDA